jgi:hypothetical protein
MVELSDGKKELDCTLHASQLDLRQRVVGKKLNLYQPFTEISMADSLSVSNQMVRSGSWFKMSQLFFDYVEVFDPHMVYSSEAIHYPSPVKDPSFTHHDFTALPSYLAIENP